MAPPPTLAALALPGDFAFAQHRLGLQGQLRPVGEDHGVEPHAEARALAHLAAALDDADRAKDA